MISERLARLSVRDVCAEIFHAALRVKHHVRHPAEPVLDNNELFCRELEKIPLAVAGVGDDYVVNGLVVVHVLGNLENFGLAAARLRIRLSELGLPIGQLIDFGRDLMVDGLVTVTAEATEKRPAVLI